MSKKRRQMPGWVAFIAAFAVLAGLLTAGSANAPPAQAADLSKFDPAYIISDDLFFKSNSMNEQQIQQFLESKVSRCAAGSVCMINYRENTNTRAADNRCSAYQGAANESAAQILAKVSRACGINPQVLLVLLQKEQGLIQNSAPGPVTSMRWKTATGYACPDTAACDTRYYGFYNQVYMAAWQFRVYTDSNYFTWFPVGRPSSIGYHPNTSCGSSQVTIRNKATSALYYYTPYQPNRAAIAAGYGTGDACSSYGNRNFFSYYSDWFGSPTGQDADRAPFGNLESVEASSGVIRLGGWAIDPDTTGPIDIQISANGQTQTVKANLPRRDVGAGYPGYGDNHGFSATIPIMNDSSVNLCVTALGDKAGGKSLEFGCRQVTIPDGPAPELARAPIGGLELVTTGVGTVRVAGWALDPDTYNPIAVHAYVGSTGVASTANLPRADVGRLYPKYGANHGFDFTVKDVSGNQQVCVYAIDTAAKGNSILGCTTVNIEAPIPNLNRRPLGNLEVLSTDTGSVTAAGWALDPDTKDPIAVHMYVGSRGEAYTADRVRTDVGRGYPGYGDKHGFSATMTGVSGTQNVCVYAIDSGRDGNTLLGCRTVTIPAATPPAHVNTLPVGGNELAEGVPGGVRVAGWTFDPDSPKTPIWVHAYVGSEGHAVQANRPRSDIARIFPAAGAEHGYDAVIPAPSGSTQNVCVYALDTTAGSTMMGCKQVRVP